MQTEDADCNTHCYSNQSPMGTKPFRLYPYPICIEYIELEEKQVQFALGSYITRVSLYEL